jgi:hypothetical protein
MMRFTVTHCKSAGYSEFQGRLIAAIIDQLGLALLREIPRVEDASNMRRTLSPLHD